MLRQIIFQREIKLYAFRNVTVTYIMSETICDCRTVTIYHGINMCKFYTYLYIICNDYFFKTDFINNIYKMLDNILNNES